MVFPSVLAFAVLVYIVIAVIWGVMFYLEAEVDTRRRFTRWSVVQSAGWLICVVAALFLLTMDALRAARRRRR